jgi:hypothetical protein
MRIVQTLVFIVICAIVAIGQTNKGGISGTVFDPHGAVVPGATVTVTNVGSNHQVVVTTSESGAYSVSSLDPVTYNILVEATGFKKVLLERVKVDTATTAAVNITLETGSITQQVYISSDAQLINTESGTPSQTITERQIVEMPLNNRSVLDLAMTVANVSGDAGTEDPTLNSDIPTPGFNISINGGRAGSTSILADGANNTGIGLARAVVTFSPDTVQEFTVQTSNFSAEFGQTGGGVINMTTKSGTNSYAGLFYWYHRNPSLNAAPFTTARVNRPQANRRQHQFGLTYSGPVRIPKIYDGRDKTFFFAAYEPRYYYDRTPGEQLLPTLAMRNGDFSNLVSVPGGFTTADIAAQFRLQATPITIYRQFDLVNGNQFVRLPAPLAGQSYPVFSGNRIPAAMLDPLSKDLLKYLPEPGDYFLNTNGELRNYVSSSFIKNLEKRLTLKLDHNLTANNRLSGRYTQVPIRGDKGSGNFQVGRDEIQTGGTDYSWSKQVLLTDTHTFSASLVNELRLNYTYGRFSRAFPPMFDALTGRNFSTELGLPSLTQGGIPEFNTGGGFIGWSQSQQNENAENSYEIADNVSWVRGSQTWKFGINLLQQRLKTIPMFGASGARYEFNRNVTLTNSAPANANGGLGFAQFLMGVYNQATLRETLIPYYYQWNSGALYAQNDWKVRPNLTINLGLRYALQLPRTEKYDRQGSFRPELAQTITLTPAQRLATAIGMALLPAGAPANSVIPAGVPTTTLIMPFGFSGRGGRSRYLTPVDKMGFEPRFGFAYAPKWFGWNESGKFVVRGGYGISHVPLTGMNRNPAPDFGGNDVAFTFDNRVQNPGFIARICCNKPQFTPRAPEDFLRIPEDGLIFDGRIGGFAVSSNYHVPYVQSWSTSAAYELPQSTVVELTYVGSRGTHLFLPPVNINPVSFELAESFFARGVNLADDVNDPLGRVTSTGAIQRYSRAYLATKFMGLEGANEAFNASANSIRHAGTISVRRRHTRGLSYTVNYTFGKGIDEASDAGGVRFVDFNIRSPGHVQFGADRNEDRSVSTFDIKHAFSTSFLWDLPLGKGRAFLSGAPKIIDGIFGGWSLSGIGRIQSGLPLTVVLRDGNRLADGNQRAIRPDVVPGVPLLNPLYSSSCPIGQECEPWFNPAAFMRPDKGKLGNAPRTFDNARYPTQEFLDFALAKNFGIGRDGKRKLQFRVDFINAFNHPNFRFGRDSDNGEIFAAPDEALLTNAQYDAWVAFDPSRSGLARVGGTGNTVLANINNNIVAANRIPGTQTLRVDFFRIQLPQGFHSANANSYDIRTPEGFKLFRMRQSYTPDRWAGLLGARLPAAQPRFIQFAVKLYF